MIKSLFRFICCLLMVSLAGCMARPAEKPIQTDLGYPGDRLFSTAEQLLDQKKVQEALAAYAQYLAEVPQGRHADRALRRMGQIYTEQGQPDTALAFYQRLLNEFGSSPYRGEVTLAMIDLMIQQNRSAEALEAARQLEAEQPTAPIRLQVWHRLVELHAATGDMASSVMFQYRILQSTAGKEQEQWANRLKESIPRLKRAEIEHIWDQIEEEPLRGDLMYQFATNLAIEENYSDASEILAVFLKAYPQHPESASARELLATLVERLQFTPLTVGCLLPLSGSYALYGQRVLNGIELALNVMQSGPAPLPIKLLIKDTASEDSRAVQAVRDLVEAKAGIILGPMITAPAAAQEAQRLQIPMITFTQKADITSAGDYIFRHFITPRSQAQTLVDFFINDMGLRNFAIMHPDDQYGKTFRAIFGDEVLRQGGRVVCMESYEPTETDFTATFKKIKGTYYAVPPDAAPHSSARTHPSSGTDSPASFFGPLTRIRKPYPQPPAPAGSKAASSGSAVKERDAPGGFDVLFIPDAPQKAGLIIPQVLYNDITGIYLAGTNLWHSPQLIEMSRDYLSGAVLVDGFFKESRSEAVQQFVQLYRDTYSADPGTVEAFAFDSARLVFTLMANPDVQRRHELRNLLLQSALPDGVTGPLSFDQNGEAIKRLFLLGIKGDRFIEIPHR